MLIVRVMVLASILLLGACDRSSPTPATSVLPPDQASLAQCGKDTDCKGDRICERGMCISPPAPDKAPDQIAPPPSPVKGNVEKGIGTFTPLRANGQITIGRCHMGSCSWAKWISVTPLESSDSHLALRAEVIGGSSEHDEVEDYPSSPDGVAIAWNAEPHTVDVTCSRTAPSVSGEVLPLNKETGVPGALESSAEFYFVSCHSHFDGYPSGIRKFSYNVHTSEW